VRIYTNGRISLETFNFKCVFLIAGEIWEEMQICDQLAAFFMHHFSPTFSVCDMQITHVSILSGRLNSVAYHHNIKLLINQWIEIDVLDLNTNRILQMQRMGCTKFN
ncbi:hypothetical protein ACJX0J_012715, partial [Zea mays]